MLNAIHCVCINIVLNAIHCIYTFKALLRKYTYLFLERCRKSNVWLRALMQSDCLYSSLFFEHYNRILLCEWVNELSSVRLIDGVSSHNAFEFYLDSTNLGISALLRSSAATKCYALANNRVKNVSVTLWFCLQCSCNPVIPPASVPCTAFCFVCLYQPAFCSVCVRTMDFISAH